MNVAAIVAAVEGRYATCASYRDKGVVSRKSDDGQRRSIEFQTTFLRPGRFRFDWIRPHPYPPLKRASDFSIRSNGQESIFRTERDLKIKDRECASLALAVARGTGISHTAALWAHQLLFPQLSPTHIKLLAIVSELRPEQALADGTSCYVLHGKRGTSDAVELWVESNLFAVRKIVLEGSVLATELHITDLHFDGPLDPTAFNR